LERTAVEQRDIVRRFVEGGVARIGEVAPQRVAPILADGVILRRQAAAVPGVVEGIRPLEYPFARAGSFRQVAPAFARIRRGPATRVGTLLARAIRAEEDPGVLDIRVHEVGIPADVAACRVLVLIAG